MEKPTKPSCHSEGQHPNHVEGQHPNHVCPSSNLAPDGSYVVSMLMEEQTIEATWIGCLQSTASSGMHS
jgi:hypothetical protein